MAQYKRIAVLTSGGDAPGMNAAIRGVVRTAYVNGITTIGVRRGYNGLINNDMYELTANDVSGITSMGGTILYTARSEEFATEAGVERAVRACEYMGVEAVVAIGGDGTFRGALDLSRKGIPTIGIPGTIDNDISCTNYTIGFDTAANTAIECIDKLDVTMQSHERCSVVEVMGRRAGHLAVYVGIATGAIAVLVPEKPYDIEADIIQKIQDGKLHGRTHNIVIVAEGVGGCYELCKVIQERTKMETRETILGHIQRGGVPNGRDRVTASRMGRHAVETLLAGRVNRVVAIQEGDMRDYDIEEALNMKKDLQETMYETSRILSLSV
ncbi:MAG: 6-phosphofructokinase [Clostridiales bacterium]|nr:6-phosphofructokinase [Clostridiales bacterium]